MTLPLKVRFSHSALHTLVLHGQYGDGRTGTNGHICTVNCDRNIEMPPEEIEKIPEIETLRIEFCINLDLSLTFLLASTVPNLKTLALKSCAIRELPSEIAALANIIDFDLGNEGWGTTSNEFTTFPPEFGSMTRLCNLRLHYNPQFEAFPPQAPQLIHLKYIGLQGFHSLPKNIELFPNLNELNLTFSTIVPSQVMPLIARPNGLKSVIVGESYYGGFEKLTAEHPQLSVTMAQTSLRGDY